VERYRYHRVFEMHDRTTLTQTYPNLDEYLEKISHCNRLTVQEGSIPGEVYPFEAVAESVGDYWCSSIAYMTALAIHEGAKEIHVLGVDMKAGEEYGHQKPNMEYLIGFARGKGIKVHIPEQSPLCKFRNHGGTTFAGRYGLSGG
jgi:hypothetical protein